MNQSYHSIRLDFDFNNVIGNGENNSNEGANNTFGNFMLNPFDLNQFINVLDDDVMRELRDDKLPCNYYLEDDFKNLVEEYQLANNTFSVFHLNVRSLRNKLDDFINFLTSLVFSFSIIGLTETWLNDGFSANEINIPGYVNISTNRNNNKIGGGVRFYIKDNLEFKVRSDIGDKNLDIESLFVEITNKKGKNIVIGVIYRPSKSKVDTFEIFMSDVLAKTDRESKLSYILDDINIDILKYDSCKFSNQP